MNQGAIMTNIMIGIIILFALLWFYAFTSIIDKKFKDKQAKQLWILAITFIPLLAFIYIFVEDDFIQSE